MPFDTTCPECGTEFRLLDKDRGKRFRCEHCSHDFVPKADRGEEDRPRRKPAIREEDSGRPAGAYWNEGRKSGGRERDDGVKLGGGSRRPRRSSGNGGDGDNTATFIAIGVGVFFLLSVAGVGFWVLSQDSDPEPPHQPNPFAGGNIDNPWQGGNPGHQQPPPPPQIKDIDSDTLLARLTPNNGLPPWERQPAMEELVRRKEQRAVAALALLLNSSERGSAQAALAKYGPSAAPQVLPYFNHPDHGTRETARSLINGFRTNSDTIITQCLKDANGTLLESQINALEWLADQNIVPKRAAEVARVQEGLLLSPDGRVRENAMKGMLKWGSKENTPAVVQMLNAFQKDAFLSNTHRWGFEALGKWKDPRGAAGLVQYLPHFFMHGEAEKALRQLGPEAAAEVAKFANHPDGGVQARVRQLLKDFGASGTLMAQSLTDLKSQDANVRRGAAEWLAQAKADEAKREEVAKALGPLLTDREHGTQAAAFKAMKDVWLHKEAVPFLIASLEDNTPRVGSHRAQAMEMLGSLKDERAVEPLARQLGTFFDRGPAANALKAMGPIAEDAVLKYLSHSDPFVKTEACHILGEIGTKKSVGPLEKLSAAMPRDFASGAARSALNAIKSRLNSP